MDAHAHLLALGWAGPGHSLDSRPPLRQEGRGGLPYDPSESSHGNNGNGLVKPLLISRKKSNFGIGKSSHEPAAGSDWWLRCFETALSKVGQSSDTSEAASGQATPNVHSASAYRGKHAGLYGFFVKGQHMEGTTESKWKSKPNQKSRGKKRKSDTLEDGGETSTGDDSPPRPESKTRKEGRSETGDEKEFAQITQFLEVLDGDRRRGERRPKTNPAKDFEQLGHFFEARPAAKSKTKIGSDPSSPPLMEVDEVAAQVAKEHRRRRRKKKKEAKMAALADQALVS
jgi:hypothetical protein